MSTVEQNLLEESYELLRSLARPGVPSQDDEMAAKQLAVKIHEYLEAHPGISGHTIFGGYVRD